jgi:hypothetical protein
MHLTEVELVDLVEATRAEASAPHLASCERCRRQLQEMRSLMAAAAAVQVPEPSPLFWDRLSDRVRQSVAAERDAPRRWWHEMMPWRRLLIPASAVAAAAILVVTAMTPRVRAPGAPIASTAAIQPGPAPAPAPAASGVLNDGFEDAADDESLTLVADLSAALNIDPATDTNLAPSGSAEHAVTHLNDDELRELQQLLKQELASSGA